jgi:hypothetical protein
MDGRVLEIAEKILGGDAAVEEIECVPGACETSLPVLTWDGAAVRMARYRMTIRSTRMMPPAPRNSGFRFLEFFDTGAERVSRLEASPLLTTMPASSSSPVPDRASFWYSGFPPPMDCPEIATAPDSLARAGTVWMVPQCWQRHTPPANASSMVRIVLQLVQDILIIGFCP